MKTSLQQRRQSAFKLLLQQPVDDLIAENGMHLQRRRRRRRRRVGEASVYGLGVIRSRRRRRGSGIHSGRGGVIGRWGCESIDRPLGKEISGGVASATRGDQISLRRFVTSRLPRRRGRRAGISGRSSELHVRIPSTSSTLHYSFRTQILVRSRSRQKRPR